MVSRGPLKIDELKRRLKSFGVVVMENKRGKGSEVILVKPIEVGSTKGPMYPIKNHGKQTEIGKPVIMAILRRFNISPDDFWK